MRAVAQVLSIAQIMANLSVMNILIVEDNKFMATALERAFRLRGHTVTMAATIESARVQLGQTPFDLHTTPFDAVILDHDVAGKNGWDLRHKLPQTTKAVLMTGAAPPDAPPHFVKGDDTAKLFEMVEGALHEH